MKELHLDEKGFAGLNLQHEELCKRYFGEKIDLFTWNDDGLVKILQ